MRCHPGFGSPPHSLSAAPWKKAGRRESVEEGVPADWTSAKTGTGQGLLPRKPRVCDRWFSEASTEAIWWLSPICWCRPTVPPGSVSYASSAICCWPCSPVAFACGGIRGCCCGSRGVLRTEAGGLFVFPDPNGAAGGQPAGTLVCGAQSGHPHLLVDHVRALPPPLAV